MFGWCVWYMQRLRWEEVWWYPKIITLILSLSYFYRLVLNPVNSCFVMVKMWAKALKWFSGINNLMTFRLLWTCGSVKWRAVYWFCLKQQVPGGSAVLPCLSVHPLLLLRLVIWPTWGQFFDVPVQLLGDSMIHVNNSTVPLYWTCVMPTVLAQRAAYFRSCTRLLLLLSSSIHWKLPRFTIVATITS